MIFFLIVVKQFSSLQNVLNQGVDTESQDLDLLRHDLENFMIQEDNGEIEYIKMPLFEGEK